MGEARTCLSHGRGRSRFARGLDRLCRPVQTSTSERRACFAQVANLRREAFAATTSALDPPICGRIFDITPHPTPCCHAFSFIGPERPLQSLALCRIWAPRGADSPGPLNHGARVKGGYRSVTNVTA